MKKSLFGVNKNSSKTQGGTTMLTTKYLVYGLIGVLLVAGFWSVIPRANLTRAVNPQPLPPENHQASAVQTPGQVLALRCVYAPLCDGTPPS